MKKKVIMIIIIYFICVLTTNIFNNTYVDYFWISVVGIALLNYIRKLKTKLNKIANESSEKESNNQNLQS